MEINCKVITAYYVKNKTTYNPVSYTLFIFNPQGNDYIFFDDRMKETSEDDEDDEDDEALESGSEDTPSGTEASISFPEVENTGRGCLSLQ